MALIARVCILIIADWPSIESSAARAIRGVVDELAGRRGSRRGWERGLHGADEKSKKESVNEEDI